MCPRTTKAAPQPRAAAPIKSEAHTAANQSVLAITPAILVNPPPALSASGQSPSSIPSTRSELHLVTSHSRNQTRPRATVNKYHPTTAVPSSLPSPALCCGLSFSPENPALRPCDKLTRDRRRPFSTLRPSPLPLPPPVIFLQARARRTRTGPFSILIPAVAPVAFLTSTAELKLPVHPHHCLSCRRLGFEHTNTPQSSHSQASEPPWIKHQATTPNPREPLRPWRMIHRTVVTMVRIASVHAKLVYPAISSDVANPITSSLQVPVQL